MNREQKKESVASLNELFSNTGCVIVTHYSGLTVEQLTSIRKKARENEVGFAVVKNRLAKIAANGTPYEGLSNDFTGPVAICYSNDPVAPAKIIVDFAKELEKLKIISGSMQENILDAEAVKSLAKLPSLDEIRASLIAMINTPAQRIASVVQAPAGNVARVIGAYARKGEENN